MGTVRLASPSIIKAIISQLKTLPIPNEFARRNIRLKTACGLSGRVGMNIEALLPGTRASVGHAHSHDDGFIYVLKGRGLAWIDGETYEVGPRDCIAFPAGTGVSHTFISDGPADGAEGQNKEDFVLLILGDDTLSTVAIIHMEIKRILNIWCIIGMENR
jgi:hypothetical protein